MYLFMFVYFFLSFFFLGGGGGLRLLKISYLEELLESLFPNNKAPPMNQNCIANMSRNIQLAREITQFLSDCHRFHTQVK